NQRPHCVNPDRAGGLPGIDELLREGGVRGEKDLEGCAVQKLRHQPSGRPEGELGLVAWILFGKGSIQRWSNRADVRGSRDRDFLLSPREREREGEPQNEEKRLLHETSDSAPTYSADSGADVLGGFPLIYFGLPRLDGVPAERVLPYRGAESAVYRGAVRARFDAQEGQTP